MKRTLIVAALASAAAAPALAQSSVTVYGRLNVSIERQKNDADQTDTKEQNNSSRIGFRGKEDLGGGLYADFNLEHGFNATNGAQSQAAFWQRQSTVGLGSNDFGHLRLGNIWLTEAYHATADWVSLHNHDTGTSSDAFYGLGFNVAGAKMQHTVAYTTPTFSGLKLDVQYGLNDGEGARRYAGAAQYDVGPLHAALGYEQFNGLKAVTAAGLYTIDAFTFGGYVERDSGTPDIAALSPAGLAGGASRTSVRLVGMYALGASEFHLNFGKAGKVDSVSGSGAKQYTLAYNYNLSKRTKVYTFYTKVDEDGALGTAGRALATSLYGGNFSSFAVGLRHNF